MLNRLMRVVLKCSVSTVTALCFFNSFHQELTLAVKQTTVFIKHTRGEQITSSVLISFICVSDIQLLAEVTCQEQESNAHTHTHTQCNVLVLLLLVSNVRSI